jgi:hypothetical protein
LTTFSDLFDALRTRGHISEHRLDEVGRAGDPIGVATPGELDHLQACRECRRLSIGFRRANAVLAGPWADRPAPSPAGAQAGAGADRVTVVRLRGSLDSRGLSVARPARIRPAFAMGIVAVAALTFAVVAVAPRFGSGSGAGASMSESPSASAAATVSASLEGSAAPRTSAPVVSTGAGAFKATGSMTVSRYAPVATTLEDGRVLVTGNGSADLYDPASGKFTATGRMVADRAVPTSTLLADGRVLIAGGFEQGPAHNGASLKSAELFDPTTGKFTATGSMYDARAAASATLLPNGLVLVSGGMSMGPVRADGTQTGSNLASAELYDPSTGTFQRTGSMTTARWHHGSTLLRNGLVLMTGGNGLDSMPVDYAELYDPATARFAASASTTVTNVDGHTATLLKDGRVLLAGAATLYPQQSRDYTSAQLYDPATGKFSKTGSLLNPASSGSATLLPNGEVLIAGAFGVGGFKDKLATTTELYDPTTGTFRAGASMPSIRGLFAVATLRDGRVLFIGGTTNGVDELATAVIFDPGATP